MKYLYAILVFLGVVAFELCCWVFSNFLICLAVYWGLTGNIGPAIFTTIFAFYMKLDSLHENSKQGKNIVVNFVDAKNDDSQESVRQAGVQN